MVGKRGALNQVQKIAGFNFAANPVVVGVTAIDIYTVPAGRKAILKSMFTRPVSFGTNTFMRFSLIVTGATLRLENVTGTETVLTEKLPNTTGILMNAGDIIRLDGDGAGDNGSMGYDIKVEETNA